MKKIFILALVLLGLALSSCAPKAREAESFAMNTIVRQTVYSANEDITQKVNEIINGLDQSLSRSVESSDIYKINTSSAGAQVEVAEETATLLARCLQEARASDGAYNPALGSLIKLWGFGSGNEKVPAAAEIEKALKNCNYNNVEVKGTSVTKQGEQIDLGGSAKGYALDILRDMLKANGVESALVSIGGSILAMGEKPAGKWKIGIRDPEGGEYDSLGTIELKDICVSTSGAYERGFTEDGVYYHHILDTKTGYPANSDLVSVTVAGQDGLQTDIYSTALFVLGLEKGLELAEDVELAALFVTKKQEVYKTAAFDELNFELTGEEYSLA